MRTKAGLYVDASETHAMLTRPEGREVVLIDVRNPNVYSMVDGFESGKANSAEPVLTR